MYDNWFKDSQLFSEIFDDKHSIGYQVDQSPDSAVSIGTKVALMGYNAEIADTIRRDLYKCSYNFKNLHLIDLGNIRKKDKEFTIQILDELREAGLNLIILGPEESLLDAQLTAIKQTQNLAFIEKSGLHLFNSARKELIFDNKHIQKVKMIGYQAHLLNRELLDKAKMNQSLSLGDIRNNMRDAEPVLRDVATVNFMLESIRYSELPGIQGTSPSGFTSEEACQLVRYTGLNPMINQLALYGYDPKYDFHDQGLKMVSQLIWYYLEGLDQKKMDKPEKKENMLEYVVELSEFNLSLSFWKSEYSGRWWVEIPIEENNNYLLPCSFMDYKIACNNEMPKRILKELS